MLRVHILVLALALVTALASNAQPVRVAIVTAEESLVPAADLLTVEFSKQPQVALLERDQINKALQELALSSMATNNYLKLGQILGADGLLILEPASEAGNPLLSARLIAVKPGVILEEHSYPWPLQNPAQWSGVVVKQFQIVFPKLRVLPKDAVPVSVLNLRSALRTGEAGELERELTQLLIDRLARERDVFVLERQRLREVVFEQDFKPAEEDSAFWTGRYLLEGILDKEGFQADKVTVSARFTPPQGGTATLIEVSGPRNDPIRVVELLADKVLATLHRNPGAGEWQPRQEADQYYEEAQWAFRWKIYREAQMASESAWALGRRTWETALLRIRSYTDDCGSIINHGYPDYSYFPDTTRLKPTLRAVALYCEDTPVAVTPGSTNLEWVSLGIQTLNLASKLLEDFYHAAELRRENEPQLSELRSLTRQLAGILETNSPPTYWSSFFGSLASLKWEYGGFWFEKADEALPMHRRTFEANPHQSDLPCIIGWSWAERKRVPSLMEEFVREARGSTNANVRLEGLYLSVVRTPDDETGKLRALENELFETLWDQRQAMWADKVNPTILTRLERKIQHKHEVVIPQFGALMQRLRMDYLSSVTLIGGPSFSELFRNFGEVCSPEEARELLPLLRQYKSKPQYRRDIFVEATYSVLDRIASGRPGSAISFATAGLPTTIPLNKTAAGAKPLAVNFTNWKLNPEDLYPGFKMNIQSALYREGRIWSHLRFQGTFFREEERHSIFVAVDPRTGDAEAIPFPAKLGHPDPKTGYGHIFFSREPFFEVTKDSLYVSAQDRLQRYRFHEKRWETIPMPVDDGVCPTELDGRLYLGNGETLLELTPDSQSVQILASTRRRPAAGRLDELGGFSVVFPWSNGKAALLAQRSVFTFTPGSRNFEEIKLPPTRNDPSSLWIPSISESGLVLLEGAWAARDYVVAAWKDSAQVETLLEQHPQFEPKPVAATVPPARWNWPEPHVLKASLVLAEGKALWTLNHREGSSSSHPNGFSLTFDDDRQATLIRFEPEFREGLCVPLKFEKEGEPLSPFDPAPGPDFTRGNTRGTPFWLNTPDGLIVECPGPPMEGRALTGHWLIPKAALEPRLASLREKLREQASVASGVESAITRPVQITNSAVTSKP